eukprot:6469839-Prymnesium_polylepis.1
MNRKAFPRLGSFTTAGRANDPPGAPAWGFAVGSTIASWGACMRCPGRRRSPSPVKLTPRTHVSSSCAVLANRRDFLAQSLQRACRERCWAVDVWPHGAYPLDPSRERAAPNVVHYSPRQKGVRGEGRAKLKVVVPPSGRWQDSSMDAPRLPR